MFGLGWPEVLLILLALALLFGPKRLPELGGSIGKALRGFKDEIKSDPDQDPQETENS
jgi:sec-independent protein translocase protein TatA